MALCDVDVPACRETLREVEAAGGEGRIEALDVACSDQWHALRARLECDWPQLDLLVNNAGVCGSGEVGEFSLDDWHWLLSTNLSGVIYGCHTMVDWLKANPRGGHIINMASIAAFVSGPTMAAYNVAKAGVVALTETMAAELATSGVSLSVVCPGFVQTGLLDRGRFATQVQHKSARWYMQRAALKPEDVAEAAVRAMRRKQLYVVLPRRARLLWQFKRLSPGLFLRTITAGYRRGLERLQRSEDHAGRAEAAKPRVDLPETE